MLKSFARSAGFRVIFILTAVVIATIAIMRHTTPLSHAAVSIKSGETANTRLPNYDIRLDKAAADTVVSFRSIAGRTAADVAGLREEFNQAEQNLRREVPTLKVVHGIESGVPEVIAPDVLQGRAVLRSSDGSSRVELLRSFLRDNSGLVGARSEQIAELRVEADYTNPDGKLSFVELNQQIHGVPVFRGEVKAGFAPDGSIIRVINNLAPNIEVSEVSSDFGDPIAAVRVAAGHLDDRAAATSKLSIDPELSTANKAVFGKGAFLPRAEKTYFPVEPGVVVPAWRVLIWQRSAGYYVIVDAHSGAMLWRKCLTEDQTQPATYNVYANPGAMANIADNPFPMTPGTSGPTGVQAGAIPRTLITRVGNEPPYGFNNLGWITDGFNKLDGNNVEAGLDREAPNLGDLDPDAIDPDSVPTGSPARVFNFPVDPAIPTNPAMNLGESPLPEGQTALLCLEENTKAAPTNFQKAIVTQLFYITNVFHDEMYRVGFTEAAKNFQNDNFGRGGLAEDRISAQAQDCSGVNNANFSTPADGERPQMQMYLWQGPNPDVDGSLDGSVVIHELGHGVSNRLHGNATGLNLDIARGMGEGWSDFIAHSLLSEPTDPLDGVYTVGAYDSYLYQTVGFNNYYYGIRRFPTAIMSSVGGPMGRPHNPLTFQDIDASKLDISDGAFDPRYNITADQVHAIGEVWASTLWEIRAKMIQRLGWEVGNRRMLQFVIDGMKLAPVGPNPVNERDALIAAIFASGTEADLADAWAGFSIRGLGAGASIQHMGGISTGGTGTVRVTESFDLPNIAQTPVISVSDASGDGDGYPEPGELVTITIPLRNASGRAASNVTARIADSSVSYGTMSGISSETRSLTYRIPSCANCGSLVTFTITVTSSLGPVNFTRSIFVGTPGSTTASENFDGVTIPGLPNGWFAVPVSDGINFESSVLSPDSAPNVMYARNPTTVGGGTDLTAPPISVTSAQATVTFRNNYNTEKNWDGGVLEISIGGGDFQDIVEAGGTFVQNGYNGFLGGGRNNPIGSRPGWTGNSNGYLTTVAQMPAAAAGKVVRLRWRFGADDNTAGTGPDPGWRVDTVSLSGAGFVSTFLCSIDLPTVTVTGRVLTPAGLPVRNTPVTLVDACSQTRRVTTSSFGIYTFDRLPQGPDYILGVVSKRYRFTPQLLNLTGDLTGVDLTGLE